MIKVMNVTEDLTPAEICFKSFLLKEIIYDSGRDEHLPVPVYLYLKSTLGVQFIHHILISLGRFTTEIDLTIQPSIREALRYAKLIGPSNNKQDLECYSDQLLYLWIEEQLQCFSIGRRILSEWIVIAGDLFDSVIVRDELAITQMPAV